MKTMDLGKVSITPRGPYSEETAYHPLDLVQYNGSSFLVKQETIGVTPEEGAYYMMISQKGDPGEKGETGATGPKGATGAAGKDGVGKKRGHRIVIGTSAAGWTADDCDYLCDGVDDQEEINAAIAAIPTTDLVGYDQTAGSVYLLSGVYHITAPIIISQENCRLHGENAMDTILLREFSKSEDNGVIEINKSFCSIDNIMIYCDKDGLPSTTSYDHGIHFNIGGDVYTWINRCMFYFLPGNGIDATGNCIITNNIANSCYKDDTINTASMHGIHVDGGAPIIANNFVYNCEYGIGIGGLNTHGLIIGNHVRSCRTNGIDGGYYSNIIGNDCCDNKHIQILGEGYNIIIGNTCRVLNSSKYGISAGKYGIIAGNYVTGSTDSGIIARSSLNTRNLIFGNLLYNTGTYSVNLQSGSTNNVVHGNLLIGKSVTNSGTSNTIGTNYT